MVEGGGLNGCWWTDWLGKREKNDGLVWVWKRSRSRDLVWWVDAAGERCSDVRGSFCAVHWPATVLRGERCRQGQVLRAASQESTTPATRGNGCEDLRGAQSRDVCVEAFQHKTEPPLSYRALPKRRDVAGLRLDVFCFVIP